MSAIGAMPEWRLSVSIDWLEYSAPASFQYESDESYSAPETFQLLPIGRWAYIYNS